MSLPVRKYNDIINEVEVKFYTDAEQSLVTTLEFNGEWCVTKSILLSWGYMVIEINYN